MLGYDAKRKKRTVSVMTEMKKIRKSIVSIEDDVSFLTKCVYEQYIKIKSKKLWKDIYQSFTNYKDKKIDELIHYYF